ncbi:NitT/TauT family transport system substrate-binding protein [Paenibacillus sp. UNCCL117]|uniref:ABC transporter substrate-binding protein n=1 Tax=unclassified Paenibacillus TaxID=185978 RepID=UPI000888C041|nr:MULTISPECIES: ABC transporter substrate-binding protein [unclassified Paenibacillus]SDD58064.1 NitT/TauT family transport system substrate-binding protein [Paenibacillus sp. cl123]SFW51074.1 NitT/TauT family transport system substrate-binding protein [Paenibacillus sp. UNCCL117]
MSSSIVQNRLRKGRLFGSIFALAFAMLLTQACGTSAGTTASTGTGAAPAGTTKAAVPAALNYGYIGTSKLNFPGGAEGWGFYKGIIQEELKKHGITEVKLTAFPNGPDLSESLISGRLDFGSLGDTPAILAKSTGAKTRFITQGATDSIGYLIGRKNGPATLAELKGKTVTTQKGSFHHRYLAGLLKENNITDVKIVHMLRVDAEAALARGEIDAMTNTGVFALKQIDQGYPLIDDATKHPNLLGTSATVVSEEYLAKNPDFPKIWNEARLKALSDLKTKPAEYYKFLAELNNSTPELMEKVSPISGIKDVPFTDEGIKLLEGTKKFLVEEKLAEKDIDINQWILK